MSTQAYTPQPGAPMRPSKLTLTQGLPEIVAIAAIPGEMASSEFGPSEVRYRLTDGRTWYVPQAVADEINIRIAPRQQFEVVRTGRGKAELRITPLQAGLAPAQNWAPPAQPAVITPVAPVAPVAAEVTPTVNQKFLAAYMVAVDTLLETKAYAQRKGLALEIRCEDVRALAATLIISADKDQQKGGR